MLSYLIVTVFWCVSKKWLILMLNPLTDPILLILYMCIIYVFLFSQSWATCWMWQIFSFASIITLILFPLESVTKAPLKVAFSNLSGIVWTRPKKKVKINQKQQMLATCKFGLGVLHTSCVPFTLAQLKSLVSLVITKRFDFRFPHKILNPK